MHPAPPTGLCFRLWATIAHTLHHSHHWLPSAVGGESAHLASRPAPLTLGAVGRAEAGAAPCGLRRAVGTVAA